MSDEVTNNLAVKIARFLQAETQDTDFRLLQETVEKISERLGKIEKKLESQTPDNFYSTPFKVHPIKHASQEKFAVDEAISHQTSESFETEKACIFEPNGKPCDYCSMCNSRGF